MGKDKTSFCVHKNLIYAKSKFFKGCIERSFSEAENRTVSLPNDNVDAVETFVIWLYSEKIDHDRVCERIDGLVATYAFGDKILSDAYCNDIIDTVRSAMKAKKCVPGPVVVRRLHVVGLSQSQLASYALSGVMHAIMIDKDWEQKENEVNDQQMKLWHKMPSLMEAFTDELFTYRKKPY